MTPLQPRQDTIPAHAGIGLRAQHVREFLETRPQVAWCEVHSENYFADGGPSLRALELVRADYPLSLHGVGLSLGSCDPLDARHLRRLKSLIERSSPALVSDHLSWSSIAGRFANDLLPLPYTEEALIHLCRRIDEIQGYLARRILIENPSTYLQYADSVLPEWEFISELARRTGCGILLDVNNVYISAVNHGDNPAAYLRNIDPQRIEEIHLAGFEDNAELLIDTHSRPVHDEVWELYRMALQRFGARPTLIEWDINLPPLDVLLAEAGKAQAILEAEDAVAA
jgi:uncharacterized protein (UPF0276 family)